MKMVISILLGILSLNGWSQSIRPTIDYVSQLGSTLALPLYMNLQGEVKLKLSPEESLTFPALLQVGYSQLNVSVVSPKDGGTLDTFEEAEDDAPKIITKRKSFELGLGAGVTQSSLAGGVSVGAGFAPYAGGFWEAINVPDSQLTKKEFWKIPDSADLWNKWGRGEARTYQVYGGLSVYVGANISVVTLLKYIHSYQGRYDIKIEKISDSTAFVRVRRENWDKDSLQSGVMVANIQVDFLKFWDRERHYYLDMNDENHLQALKHMWRGNLLPIQKLGAKAEFDERNFWMGNQQMFYVGIPWVAGKVFSRSMLQKIDRKDDSKHLWMLSAFETNTGLAVQARTKRSIMTYQPSQGRFNTMISFERNKTTLKMLQKDIFDFIEALSNQKERFNIKKEKLGYSLSTINIDFSETQLMNWVHATQNISSARYQEICILRSLSCAKKLRAQNRIKRLKKFTSRILKAKKDQMKERLMITFLGYLMKRPALWAEVLSISNDHLNLNLTYVGSKYYPYHKEFQVPVSRLQSQLN